MHHKKDERIRAHVFLCVLAYCLLWHFQERRAPLYVEQQEQNEAGELSPKERCWTLQGALESLKSMRRNQVQVAGTSFEQDSEPTGDQQRILSLLCVTLPRPKP
jgi:transposase